MSVRKRTWKTAAAEERQAWLCDYTGQSGKRHVKTFARKKDADAFIAKAKVEVREGVHTADSDSVTIRDAADLWLTTAGLSAPRWPPMSSTQDCISSLRLAG